MGIWIRSQGGESVTLVTNLIILENENKPTTICTDLSAEYPYGILGRYTNKNEAMYIMNLITDAIMQSETYFEMPDADIFCSHGYYNGNHCLVCAPSEDCEND